ncbi:MAG: hypothetical protein ABI462_03570 [Ignavibacteria bacterium]
MNTEYYWRVNAVNINGTGSWSSVWEFTTLLVGIGSNGGDPGRLLSWK